MPKMIRIIVFTGPTEWLDGIEKFSWFGEVTKVRIAEDATIEEILKIRTDKLDL